MLYAILHDIRNQKLIFTEVDFFEPKNDREFIIGKEGEYSYLDRMKYTLKKITSEKPATIKFYHHFEL